MTRKDALTLAINTLSTNDNYHDAVQTLTKMLDSVNHKSETRKLSPKEIAQNEQNAIFRAKVHGAMGEEPNRLWQVKELADMFKVSSPKMSAALTALRKANLVKREEGFNGKVITFQYLLSEEKAQ